MNELVNEQKQTEPNVYRESTIENVIQTLSWVIDLLYH